MKYITRKVLKMGNKIGIFLGEDFETKFGIKKGEYVYLTIINRNKEFVQLSKMNYNIVLRKFLKNKFNQKDIVKLKIQKIINLKRPKNMFHNDKIDILSLIPITTSKGYEIIVNEFDKNKEKWLRVWYTHGRGSGRQFSIRRYIDISTFGGLLGQLQAEGTKRDVLVEFANKLLTEHKDFISSLNSLGISRKDISVIKFSTAYKTIVRYSGLASILLNSMNIIRQRLTQDNLDPNLQKLRDAFLSKLLTGDGTLDISRRTYPNVRIKIVDRNIKHLYDYKAILKTSGFKPHVDEKRILVKSVCSFHQLLYLYKIEAFKNTRNWEKLIVAIKLLLGGRRLKTNYRFCDLLDHEKFTSLAIRDKYNVTLRAANDWIENKIKEEYVRIVKNSIPIEYELTEKAIKLATVINQLEERLKEINKIKTNNMQELMDTLKTKSFQPKRAPTQ